MAYAPFSEQFPEVAAKETRSMKIFDHPLLAGDEFGFVELFCDDENCDCRRVFFNVMSQKRKSIVAVITYGWEDRQFYVNWYGRDEPNVIGELKGPALNSASQQSELSLLLLPRVRDVLLTDANYVARIKRHYRMFKQKIDLMHFQPGWELELEAGQPQSGLPEWVPSQQNSEKKDQESSAPKKRKRWRSKK